MKQSKSLKFRCLLQREGDLYLAFCIDLSLAVQGDSEQEVRNILHDMICDYVQDAQLALAQGDREQYEYMMSRKAPFSTRARYHVACVPGGKVVLNAISRLHHFHNQRLRTYYESMDNAATC